MITSIIQSTVPQILATFGIVLPSTSRAFLPAFLAALYLKAIAFFGSGTQFTAIAEIAEHEASWFCSTPTIFILGVLAIGELFVSKSKEVEELVRQADPLVKPAIAALTTFGILDSTDSEILGTMADGLEVSRASLLGWEMFLSLVSGGLVFVTVWLRTELLELLDEMELDGLARFISWMEELWVVGLMFLFALLPALLLFVTAVALGAMALVERLLTAWSESRRVPCPHCRRPRFPHGRFCPGCRAPNPDLRAVGAFGLSATKPSPDPARQPLELLSKGRCSACAAGLVRGRTGQQCTECGYVVFGADGEVESFVDHINQREKQVLLICFLLSLIPVLGVIPAVFLYRLRLVVPYRRYLPRWQGIGLRWTARLISFFLLLLQSVPVIGAVSLPAMAWVNHRLYRSAFKAAARSRIRHPVATETKKELIALLPAPLRAAGERLKHPLARPVLVATFVAASMMGVVTGFLFSPSARAAQDCPGDRYWLEGVWKEDWTRFELLEETFLEDGVYLLNGIEGRWSYVSPGHIRLTAGPAVHDYDLWVADDRMYYRAADGTLSTYQRRGSAPDRLSACPDVSDRAPGVWYDDKGATLQFGQDRSLIVAGARGSWSEHGGELRLVGVGLAQGTRALINDADALLVVEEDRESRVFRRTPPTAAPAVATGPSSPGASGLPPTTPTTPSPLPGAPMPPMPPPAAAPVEAGEPEQALAELASEPEWQPLERPWTRIFHSGADYDYAAEPNEFWATPAGTVVQLTAQETETSPTATTVTLFGEWPGSGRPRVFMRYRVDQHAANPRDLVVYVGVRVDGRLLVSMEALPRPGLEWSHGDSRRAVLDWDPTTNGPRSLADWEGPTAEVPQQFRIRRPL